MLYRNRTTQYAIAAMSRLAELYGTDAPVTAPQIAQARGLPRPVVAKVLTVLARARLVAGSPGPGGGYRLARPPHEISLLDVVSLFECDDDVDCPFGPGWCGRNDPCPLHESLMRLRDLTHQHLRDTRFDAFLETARTTPDRRTEPAAASGQRG